MAARSINLTLEEMEKVVNLRSQFPAWQVGQMIGKSSVMVRYIVRRYNLLKSKQATAEQRETEKTPKEQA